MDIYRSLESTLEKNYLAHYELAYFRRSGQIVDSSAKWGTEENKRGIE